MRRLLFNFVAAVSLVVCVAAVSLWIRSAAGAIAYERRAWDEAALTVRHDSVSLYNGIVRVGAVRQRLGTLPRSNAMARIRGNQSPWSRPSTAGHLPGTSPRSDLWLYSFRSDARQLGPEHVSQWAVRLRLWPLAGIAAVMPGVWVTRKFRHARRVRMGHCISCGYDLRATPLSGGALLDRCPECGARPGTIAGPAA
jgi:hypothetical protein